MATSKLQRQVSQFLSRHCGQYTVRENIRPEWLEDEMGARLELDFWIEELHLAIEVQGAQHYRYSEHFHGDEAGFQQRLERDRFKRERCALFGICLVEISAESEMEELYGLLDLGPVPRDKAIDFLQTFRLGRSPTGKQRAFHCMGQMHTTVERIGQSGMTVRRRVHLYSWTRSVAAWVLREHGKLNEEQCKLVGRVQDVLSG